MPAIETEGISQHRKAASEKKSLHLGSYKTRSEMRCSTCLKKNAHLDTKMFETTKNIQTIQMGKLKQLLKNLEHTANKHFPFPTTENRIDNFMHKTLNILTS